MFNKNYSPKSDLDYFGQIFEIFGGVLFSFGVLEFMKTLPFPISHYWIIAGMGILFFSVGYWAKRNISEFHKSAMYLLIVLFSIAFLLALIKLVSYL